ncbi:MAG: TIR domain-containing protein [Bdellovibrionales bacterium]|nr:TIR domain-containing protein [Candidatus Obscuribacterales bacterium]MBY0413914.1 TIR domain-containing protein [Bdellovibrionales bacterium]
MANKKVFYSFHFDKDVMRVQQVRNIGVIEDNKPVTENTWEEVKKKGDAGVKSWIDENLKGKECLVVLVGEETSKRPWVQYEIEKAWGMGIGVVGVNIHNLKCPRNGKSTQGSNPFDNFTVNGKSLSTVVKCHNPSSSDAYNDIAAKLEGWVKDAITARK